MFRKDDIRAQVEDTSGPLSPRELSHVAEMEMEVPADNSASRDHKASGEKETWPAIDEDHRNETQGGEVELRVRNEHQNAFDKITAEKAALSERVEQQDEFDGKREPERASGITEEKETNGHPDNINGRFQTGDGHNGEKQGDLELGTKTKGDPCKNIDDDDDDDDNIKSSKCLFFVAMRYLKDMVTKYSSVLTTVIKVVLFLLYLGYTGYALSRTWGTEAATSLLLLLVFVLYATLGKRLVRRAADAISESKFHERSYDRARKIARWCVYVVVVVGAVTYVTMEVAIHRPRNLVCLAGLVFLVLVSVLISANPERVNWHTVFLGISLQFYLGVFVLRTSVGYEIFMWLGDRMMRLVEYTDMGSEFIFGKNYTDHRFAFKLMPIILFVNTVIAILYHFGVIQAFIATFGRFLAFCLGTTPIESVNAASNIFLSVTEAPLLLRPFLNDVTEAELFAIMTGGFASIAGSAMGTIVAFGIPANHVLAASVMSAPAALAIAKLIYPSTHTSSVTAQDVYTVDIGSSNNLLGAISKAAVAGVQIIAAVVANILVLVAILEFADKTVEWFGDQAGLENMSLRRLLGYFFYPLMFVMGVDTPDLLVMSRLFGLKFVTNLQLAYMKAADIIKNSEMLATYIAETNGTWYYSGDDVILESWNTTLVDGVMTERGVVMSTYILCGMCNLPALALTIGAMSAMAPKRATFIVNQAVWAVIAGNMACLMTGCVAGLLFI